MKVQEVRTRRLILRAARMSDYLAWYQCWTGHRPAQNRWDTGPRNPGKCSRSAYRKLVQKLRKLAKDDKYYRLDVFEKKSGQLIGSVDFSIFHRHTHQFANFGYVIYNRYWGQGYGQEAAKAGLKIGFEQLRLHRLEAAINLDNAKSIRMAKAIGLKSEGLKRKYWFEDGEWVDHLIYVGIPEDFGLRPRKPF